MPTNFLTSDDTSEEAAAEPDVVCHAVDSLQLLKHNSPHQQVMMMLISPVPCVLALIPLITNACIIQSAICIHKIK